MQTLQRHGPISYTDYVALREQIDKQQAEKQIPSETALLLHSMLETKRYATINDNGKPYPSDPKDPAECNVTTEERSRRQRPGRSVRPRSVHAS
jgi:hypothetical protein